MTAVQQAVERDFASLLRGSLVATYKSNTESGFEYNFDHSSGTDYKYESHTGTERGTSSETKTSEAIDHNTSFRGLSFREFEEILVGPLISEAVIKRVAANIEATLGAARQQVV